MARRSLARLTSAGMLAFLGGLVVLAIALVVVLSHAPLVLAGSNGVAGLERVGFISSRAKDCQRSGTIPRGTSAIRVSLSANAGPRVSVRVLEGSRVLAHGTRPGGWGATETVTVSVTRVAHPVHDARVCTTIATPIEYLQLNGTPGAGGSVLLRLEYLRPGPRSWFSLAPSISRELGLGHAFPGTWIVFALLAMMLAAVALVARVLLKELR